MIVAWGEHSPFYHLWYMLPKMGQFRAPGLAFFMVALVACVFAGFGVDRLLDGAVTRRALFTVFGVLGAVAILAAGGVLQGITESLADARMRLACAQANATELQAGGIRLFLAVLLGGGLLVPDPAQRRCTGPWHWPPCCCWLSAETTGQSFTKSRPGSRRPR